MAEQKKIEELSNKFCIKSGVEPATSPTPKTLVNYKATGIWKKICDYKFKIFANKSWQS